ncbi:MAG: xylulokinase [Phycisphaerae bacterium]
MPPDPLFLGLDIGTTGAKALLIDAAGRVVSEALDEYALHTPRPLWSEQAPADWWRGACAAIRRVLATPGVDADAVAAVGPTGQMHGLVLLDARGDVLRPAILWNDQRTADECAEITRRVGPDRVLQFTGNPVLPGFTAPKLLWVQRNEPDVYARVAHILLPKDYVRYRLSLELYSDVADSSGTALFDVGARRWSREMCAALDLPAAWLPQVVESPVVCARVSASAAGETGLRAGTPIVGGAGDQAAQAVGAGIVDEGLISATIGTSGVVFAASRSYRVEPQGRLHAFCHAVPGMWHLMGVMLSAGGSLRWYRDALCELEVQQAARDGRDVYDLLCEQAAAASPGCEGLIFLPYLSGERTPHADPAARGVFFGLTLRHTKAHLTRAVIEGVSFGLRDSLELLRALGVTADEIHVSGGGARSTLWRQILADLFNTPIVTSTVSQGAAYGAALLAAVGAGAFADVPATARAASTRAGGPAGERISPSVNRPIYEKAYERYRALYPALAPQFHRQAPGAD